ncbi:unnamed protein product [Lampetra planeri]
MQKSLSVIASAKEKMPGLTNKTQSVEDASKKGLKGQEGRTLSEVDETPEHYPKMIISQSVEYSKTPMKMGIMKQQVSGSQPSICSETGRSLYDVSEVCPWELEEPQTPSEVKSQKHVSIAPGETTAGPRGSSSSSGITKCSRSQQRQKPGQSPSNRRRSKDKGGEREESREVRKSRPPRSPLPLKPDVCPWEFDEQPMQGRESRFHLPGPDQTPALTQDGEDLQQPHHAQEETERLQLVHTQDGEREGEGEKQRKTELLQQAAVREEAHQPVIGVQRASF